MTNGNISFFKISNYLFIKNTAKINIKEIEIYFQLKKSIFISRIGFSIAKRLAQEGAKVMISSRKEDNVNKAVQQLVKEGLQVSGVVCHVGKQEDRKKLLDEVLK